MMQIVLTMLFLLYNLDEIKEFNTDLIEMETSLFYLMADLLEIPSIALLVVSDNSAADAALVGRKNSRFSGK